MLLKFLVLALCGQTVWLTPALAQEPVYEEDGLQDYLFDLPDETNLEFKSFGDLGMSYRNPPHPDRGQTSFGFGTLDFILTGNLSENLRFFSETLLESEHSNEIELDQERTWVEWQESDSFYLRGGMDLTVSSHWNREFNHGRWLEQSTSRPFLAAFQDDGGALQMHEVGIQAGGSWGHALGRSEWLITLSNGRGPLAGDRQRIADVNNAKAIGVSLELVPKSLDALSVGVALRTDLIPPDPTDPARGGTVREELANLFAYYEGERVEILSELGLLQHEDHASAQNFRHRMAFVQLALPGEDYTPYTRFDVLGMELGDPYLSPESQDLDRWRHTVGLRKEISSSTAMKFELAYGWDELRNGGTTAHQSYFQAAFQIAWVF